MKKGTAFWNSVDEAKPRPNQGTKPKIIDPLHPLRHIRPKQFHSAF